MLQNEDGKTLIKYGKPCLFYASELMQYHGDNQEPSVSKEQALVLNGVERRKTDIDYLVSSKNETDCCFDTRVKFDLLANLELFFDVSVCVHSFFI